jgi:hypothetical protein
MASIFPRQRPWSSRICHLPKKNIAFAFTVASEKTIKIRVCLFHKKERYINRRR